MILQQPPVPYESLPSPDETVLSTLPLSDQKVTCMGVEKPGALMLTQVSILPRIRLHEAQKSSMDPFLLSRVPPAKILRTFLRPCHSSPWPAAWKALSRIDSIQLPMKWAVRITRCIWEQSKVGRCSLLPLTRKLIERVFVLGGCWFSLLRPTLFYPLCSFFFNNERNTCRLCTCKPVDMLLLWYTLQ